MAALLKNRKKIAFVVGAATSVFSVTNVIVMGIENDLTLKDIIVQNDEECVIKASYGMYTVGTIVEIACLVFVALTILVDQLNKEFYYVNLFAHIISFLAFFSATLVYGIKLQTKIYWYFWFGLFGGVFSLANLLYWFSTQMFRRYLKREHPEDPNLQASGGDSSGGQQNQGFDDNYDDDYADDYDE